MTAPVTTAAIPAAPTKPLSAWIFDIALWGGIAAVLLISFKAVDLPNLKLLVTRSSDIGVFAKELLPLQLGVLLGQTLLAPPQLGDARFGLFSLLRCRFASGLPGRCLAGCRQFGRVRRRLRQFRQFRRDLC